MRWNSWKGLLLTGVFLATALAAAPIEAQAQAKTFKFGINTPLSGPAAPWGTYNTRGMILAAEKINAAGGFTVAGQKYNVELVTYDHKYKGPDAVANIKRLVFEDNVKYMSILGGGVVPACQAITEANKVMVFAFAYGGKSLTNPDNPFTFRAMPESLEGNAAAYPFVLKEHPQIKQVALINPDDDVGWAGSEDSRWIAGKVGLKVVSNIFFDRTITDFYPIATKVIAAKPDMVDSSTSPAGSWALLCKALRELGYTGVLYQGSVMDVGVIVKTMGAKAAEGMYLSLTVAEPVTAAQKEVARVYISKWGEPFLPQIFDYYHCLFYITQAFSKAGTFDTSKVAHVLEDMQFESTWGKSAFGGKAIYGIKRQVLWPFVLSKIVNGQGKVVAVNEPPQWLY
jgi:branched-chain amino acid transport system substrate-binding protein